MLALIYLYLPLLPKFKTFLTIPLDPPAVMAKHLSSHFVLLIVLQAAFPSPFGVNSLYICFEIEINARFDTAVKTSETTTNIRSRVPSYGRIPIDEFETSS